MKIEQLVRPKSLEQAHEILKQSPRNVVLGGCGFLRLGNRKIETALDLSCLGLNQIVLCDDQIEIGAYVTYGQIERSELMKSLAQGILPKAVGSILGVQFRNMVTVGGSVFPKYGFSDFLTPLSVLNAEVELFPSGRMSITEFLSFRGKNEILVKLYLPNNPKLKAEYIALRNSTADFPLVNLAISQNGSLWKVAVGSRPGPAKLAEHCGHFLSEKDLTKDRIVEAGDILIREMDFESNRSASATYRQQVVKHLFIRALACWEERNEC